MNSFSHATLKIEWSRKLIDELDRHVIAFCRGEPYAASTEHDPKKRAYIYRVGASEPIPAIILMLTCDAISNLRASLDYAWMGLVRSAHNGPGTPTKKTMPIADNRKGLLKSIEQTPIGGAIERAKAILGDTIKPHRDFANGGNRPLIALNELSNWNKHNMIVLSTSRLTAHSVSLPGFRIGKLVIDGYEAPPVLTTDIDGEFSSESEPAIEVVFGPHNFVEGQAVVPTLRDFHKTCTEAIKAFKEAFPAE